MLGRIGDRRFEDRIGSLAGLDDHRWHPGLLDVWEHVSWAILVASGDEAIPPDAERQFAKRMGATTVEVPSNHCAMVSHPDEVVQLIETAAKAVAVRDEAVAI